MSIVSDDRVLGSDSSPLHGLHNHLRTKGSAPNQSKTAWGLLPRLFANINVRVTRDDYRRLPGWLLQAVAVGPWIGTAIGEPVL